MIVRQALLSLETMLAFFFREISHSKKEGFDDFEIGGRWNGMDGYIYIRIVRNRNRILSSSPAESG